MHARLPIRPAPDLLVQAVVHSRLEHEAFQPLLLPGARLCSEYCRADKFKRDHCLVLEYQPGRSDECFDSATNSLFTMSLPPLRVQWEADGKESWVSLGEVNLEVLFPSYCTHYIHSAGILLLRKTSSAEADGN